MDSHDPEPPSDSQHRQPKPPPAMGEMIVILSRHAPPVGSTVFPTIPFGLPPHDFHPLSSNAGPWSGTRCGAERLPWPPRRECDGVPRFRAKWVRMTDHAERQCKPKKRKLANSPEVSARPSRGIAGLLVESGLNHGRTQARTAPPEPGSSGSRLGI